MRALSAPDLLGAWERGLGQGRVDRALTLLAAACGATPDALERLTIGQRDALLLTLREWTFGARMSGILTCPACGERLELSFDVAAIRADAGAQGGRATTLTKDGYDVEFRSPDSGDLLALAGEHDPERQRQLLLARCLLAARHGGESLPAERLPAAVVEAVTEAMARADPQADVTLAASCSACGHLWRAVFDIVSFFWAEIDAWAGRVLRDVHALASAYGWPEREILALSPQRRQIYLEMVTG